MWTKVKDEVNTRPAITLLQAGQLIILSLLLDISDVLSLEDIICNKK